MRFGSCVVKRGYRTKGLCTRCIKDEQYLTSCILELATDLGIIELDSPGWYHLFKNGIGVKLDSKAQILTVKCQRLNKVPCRADAVKPSRWGTFKRQYAIWSRYRTPEEYSCCQEDGLPRRWWQPSGCSQGQRSTPMGNPYGPEPSHAQNN